MSRKLAVKLLIDLGLTITMLTAFAYHLTGNTTHELIGVLMFILLIVHNWLNLPWHQSLGQRGKSPRRRFSREVTLILLVTAIALLITSLLVSRVLFGFIGADDGFLMRQLHTLAAYWTLVLISVHVGVHWDLILAAMRWAFGLGGCGRLRSALVRLSALAVMAGGVWASFERGMGDKLLMRHSFDYWDGSLAGLWAAYLLIMGLYIGLTHYSLKFFQKRKA